MEKALYVKTVSSLIDAELKSAQRIYFGAEFCEHLIPEWSQVQQAMEFAGEHDLGFSFVTPFVADKGIEKLEKILGRLNQQAGGCEVIINDYGVIVLAQKYSRLTLVAGRLLSKQRRDPNIARLKNTYSSSRFSDLGRSQFSSRFLTFIKEKGVSRVELDILPQGICDDFSSNDIDVSVYFPYTYLTTTRLCFFNQRPDCDIKDIIPCDNRECQNYGVFRLMHPNLASPILLKGNTQFFENKDLPEDLQRKGVNRIIHEKEIPL